MSQAVLGPVVMRRSSRGAMRIPQIALSGQRTRVYPSVRQVQPSIIPSAPVDFDTERFGVCGRWKTDTVLVPRTEQTERLARYLALRSGPPEGAWDSAEASLPGCFRAYRVVTLFDRTLVLPAGSVVFQVDDLPVGKLPDDPPDRVYGLISTAILQSPSATFSLLTPVFDVPPVLEEPVRLATEVHLSAMQFQARNEVERHARRWGPLYRFQAWCEEQARKREALELAKKEAVKLRNEAREAARALIFVEPERLSPALLAVQQRVRSQLQTRRQSRAPLMNPDELGQVLGRLRRFDPIVVFADPNTPSSLRMVAHWMRIRTKSGEVRLLVHE